MSIGRIKVTGYIEVDDLDPGDRDDTNETGLSAKGYEYLTTMSGGGETFAVGDLEDLEIRRVD